MSRYCPECGLSNSINNKFCTRCGASLRAGVKRPKQIRGPGISSDFSDSRIDEREYNYETPRYPAYPYQYPPQHYHPYYYPPYPYYYPYPPQKTTSEIAHIFAGLAVIPSYLALGAILVINVLMLIFGLGIVSPNTLTGHASIVLIYPWPNFVHPITISGAFLTVWFIFIVIAIILSVIWLFKSEGMDFLKILRNSFSKFHPPPSKSKNSFVIIAQLFFAILFFHLLITIIFSLLGIVVESPESGGETAIWEPFFYLANASVAEEIFARVIYIGLPLLAFDSIVRKRTQKIQKYFVGGGFKIEHITIALIFFSSLLFGLAHYPSWGLWKVLPTFAAGLGFGYLFVRKGIHTAIILHFLIDYMVVVLIFFQEDLGILIFLSLIMGLIMLFWLVSGSIYFSIYIHDIIKFISSGFTGVDSAAKPTGATATGQGTAYKENNQYNIYWQNYYGPLPNAYWQYPSYPKPYRWSDSEKGRIRYCTNCGNKLEYDKETRRWYCKLCSID